ncbi:hypothetical protein CNEO2_1290007 [Clostridium neonatale]|uniref:Uncharacterized protein n=1 Tax=Clostridium neonatale TaxID=137838 RepID=A0AAD1YCK9_9CLOT|nr:hypothetical protein CNEO2_1390007 [Clostridium neonatale]CAI3195922.1 hypothetical protein CNEO2_1480004 [Clostridium neonatale]CAI3202694.1 hypothetical protein CNEO2_2250006 [Clostridium neonatale]CAI3223057.1 hypothetical protein CNEO2_1330007 [Clostridium neonatale]CAI3224965.1 hypothetical protein CNEO2_1530004 [Clostridium neonatale]
MIILSKVHQIVLCRRLKTLDDNYTFENFKGLKRLIFKLTSVSLENV